MVRSIVSGTLILALILCGCASPRPEAYVVQDKDMDIVWEPPSPRSSHRTLGEWIDDHPICASVGVSLMIVGGIVVVVASAVAIAALVADKSDFGPKYEP